MTRMSLARASSLLPLTLLALASCGPPSAEDLDVHGAITSPAFNLTTAPAPRLKGGWTLTLTLGKQASSASEVSQINFQLVEANGAAAPVALPLAASATTSKHVDPGVAEAIEFNFDSASGGGMQLELAKVMPLCSGVWSLTGTFADSARGKTTPITGPPVAIVCCGAGQTGCM